MGASAMLKPVPSEDAAVAVLMNMYDSEFINLIADTALRVLLPDLTSLRRTASDRRPTTAVGVFSTPVGTYVGTIRTAAR
jgi:hypothetical protein